MSQLSILFFFATALIVTLQVSADPLPLRGCFWGGAPDYPYGSAISLHKDTSINPSQGSEMWQSKFKGENDFYVKYDTKKQSLVAGHAGQDHHRWVFTFHLKGPQPGAQWGAGPDVVWDVYLWLDPKGDQRECIVPQFVQKIDSMTVQKIKLKA